MTEKFRFACVNEDGETYDIFDNVEEALAMLESFPNDTVVITVDRGRVTSGVWAETAEKPVLLPVESMVLTMALGIYDRGEPVPEAMALICVLALARVAGVRDWTKIEETT